MVSGGFPSQVQLPPVNPPGESAPIDLTRAAFENGAWGCKMWPFTQSLNIDTETYNDI